MQCNPFILIIPSTSLKDKSIPSLKIIDLPIGFSSTCRIRATRCPRSNLSRKPVYNGAAMGGEIVSAGYTQSHANQVQESIFGSQLNQ